MAEYTYLEYLAADLLTYMPFILLFLYVFKMNFRFNSRITVCILLLLTTVYLACNLLTSNCDDRIIHITTYIMTALCIAAALVVIKANIGRIVFMALLLKNCADYVVVTAKFIEHLIWPAEALEIYNWTYALTIAVFELFFVTGLFIVMRKHFVLDNVGAFYSKSWRYLWIVPLFFYYTWISLYYSRGSSSLESALHVGNCILLTLSIMCQILIYICLVRLVNNANEKVMLREKLHIYDLQTLQNKNIEIQLERASQMRHDLRHHAFTLKALAEDEDYSKIIQYLDDYINTINSYSTVRYCKNNTMNALLAYYGEKCHETDIDYDVLIDMRDDIPLSDVEISILFGNLLENAFEGCNRLDSSENRFIIIRGRTIQNQLAFTIQNSASNDLIITENESIPSSKRSSYGIGTKSCRHIAEAASGTIEFSCKNGIFNVELIIPCHPSNS